MANTSCTPAVLLVCRAEMYNTPCSDFHLFKSTDGQPQTYQLLKGVLFNGQSGGQLVLLLTFILSSCNKINYHWQKVTL